MPTASVQDFISDGRARTRLRIDVRLPILALAAMVAIALFAPTIQPGPFVKQVTVVNNSEYAFNVAVAGAHADDWMLLGTVADHASTSVTAVFDQGSTWTFHISTQGRDVGNVVLSRAQLTSAGWKVVLPDAFAAKLRSEGVVPTA